MIKGSEIALTSNNLSCHSFDIQSWTELYVSSFLSMYWDLNFGVEYLCLLFDRPLLIYIYIYVDTQYNPLLDVDTEDT